MTASAVESYDFIQGSGSVERSQLLLPFTNYTDGQQTPNIAISTWGSVLVNLNPGGGVGAGIFVIDAVFVAGIFAVAQETVSFSSDIYESQDTEGFYWQLPAIGDQVILKVHTTDTAGLSIAVTGTTRALAGRHIEPVSNRGRLVYENSGVSVAAGQNSPSSYLPPTDNGYVYTYNIPGTGDCTLRMQGIYLNGATPTLDYSTILPSGNGISQNGQVPIGNVGHLVFFHNATSVAVTCSARIWERVP